MVIEPPLLVLAALGLMLAAAGPLNEDPGFEMMANAPPDAEDAATLAAIAAAPKCEATPAMRERTDGSQVEALLMTCPGPDY